MRKLFLILIYFPILILAQDIHSEKKDNFSNNQRCLSDQDRFLIFNEIKENLKIIKSHEGIFNKNQSTSFEWVLKKDTSLIYNNYYGISNFVDHDTSSSLLDYNCLSRTYDGHKGTDIFTWPFPWYLYNNDYIDVISGTDGIIINKHDGNDDNHCASTAGGNWNAVYIQHFDGSIAWYGHLKKNSLTSKTVGQSVIKGEYLGKVASSGNSTGPHLHLEVYDSSNNLIDPFQGVCNSLNSNSWWFNQRNFREPTLNTLLTHHSKPIHDCPSVNEKPNFSNNFTIGDTVFLAAYYSDREAGDSAIYRVKDPSNTIWNSWIQVSSSTYNASWYYWKRVLPSNGPFGLWSFEIDFHGDTYTHEFQYGRSDWWCIGGVAGYLCTQSPTQPSGTLVSGPYNDSLVCATNCIATNILDHGNISNRKRIKVINVLGKETKGRNQLLFYIYDDGTVEKRITVE